MNDDISEDEAMDGIKLPPSAPVSPTKKSMATLKSEQSLELLVTNLDFSTPTSAVEQLQAILDRHRDPRDPLFIPPYINAVSVKENTYADHAKIRGGTIQEMSSLMKMLLNIEKMAVIWSPAFGEDKTRKVSINLRPIDKMVKDEPKLRIEMEKAFKEQYDVKLTSWYISHGRNDHDDPKLHIRIDKFAAVDKILEGNIKVANNLLTVSISNVNKAMIPLHPYQLIIAPPDGVFLDKGILDLFTLSYGRRFSDMPHQNRYTFIVRNWKETERLLKEWDPIGNGLGELPVPQLVYFYNTMKHFNPSYKKTIHDITTMRRFYDHLTALKSEMTIFHAALKAELKEDIHDQNVNLVERFEAARIKDREYYDQARQRDRQAPQYALDTITDKFVGAIFDLNSKNNAFQAALIDHVNNTAIHNQRVLISAIGTQNQILTLINERESHQHSLIDSSEVQKSNLTKRIQEIESELAEQNQKLNNILQEPAPLFKPPPSIAFQAQKTLSRTNDPGHPSTTMEKSNK